MQNDGVFVNVSLKRISGPLAGSLNNVGYNSTLSKVSSTSCSEGLTGNAAVEKESETLNKEGMRWRLPILH